MKILFVCTGNTCRSVMAELILKKMAEEKGIEGIEVSSAGTAAFPYYKIHGELEKVMKKKGLDTSSHSATQINNALIGDSDIILVMEQKHKDYICAMQPRAGTKVFLLREYAGEKDGKGIPDPIGMPEKVYSAAFKEIEKYLEKSFSIMMKKRKA